ncbi:unnamed protein product [Closterium sp. NIES-53]
MVGSNRFISNARPIPRPTVFIVANSQELEARACGIVVLKGRDSDIHITLNNVLIIRDLKYNLLSYEQLVHSGILISTDPKSRCILMHWKDYSASGSELHYIDKACPDNGVYILDFDIPNYRANSADLIDLQPQRAVWPYELAHPDRCPWVKHHAHPKEIDLHAPGPDGLCRNCLTPTASTTKEKTDKQKAPADEGETSAAGERHKATAEAKGKAKISDDTGAEAEPSVEAESSKEA